MSGLPWRRALAVALAGALVAALAPHTTASPTVCAHAKSDGMQFKRKRGLRYGRLTWEGKRGTTYRVFRNGVVVGQTRRRSMPVRVKAGRLYAFSVRVVRTSGVVAKCVGTLRQRVVWFGPAKPRKPVVRKTAENIVHLRWARTRPGDARVARYRVYRDGKVHREVRRRAASMRLLSSGTYRMQVAGVDSRYHVGTRSDPVVVQIGHRPPGAPALSVTGTTDTEVSLSWTGAPGGSARITGYRIYRNGAVVRQVPGLSASVGNLAPATDYKFTVAAVDARGYIGASAPVVAVRTAPPPPSDGRIHAFLLASTDSSFEALQRSYRRIGALYPTYFNCRHNTSAIVGKDDPLVTSWAKLRQISVMPRFNCQHPQTLHHILTNPRAREESISALVALVNQHAYDGLNIDFEAGYESDRDALTAYVKTLATRLRPKKISVDVSAKWEGFSTSRNRFYDYVGLVTHAAHVFVMNWGYHWSASTPGSPDPLPSVRRAADYVASLPFRRRFIIGSPLYGMDWPAGGGPAHPATAMHHSEVAALAGRYGVRPRLDPTAHSWHFKYTDAAGVGHDVWFNDRTTLAARMQVAKERGLGFGVWRLGQEDPGVWDLPLTAPANWPDK